jgi:hypothetical protein
MPPARRRSASPEPSRFARVPTEPAIISRLVTEPGAREALRPQAGQSWRPSYTEVHQLLEVAARLPIAARHGDLRKRHPFAVDPTPCNWLMIN